MQLPRDESLPPFAGEQHRNAIDARIQHHRHTARLDVLHEA